MWPSKEEVFRLVSSCILGIITRESQVVPPSNYSNTMARKSQRKKKALDYKKLTLDELSDLHDADDEEIEEDEAFNSEDEKEFGQYFDNQGREVVNKSYLGLTVPLSGDEGSVVHTEIKKGHKMTLSSVCLDVPSGDFRQIKLMVRCIYLGGTDEPWLCLGNFLGQKNGGMAVSPSIPINLEAVGPCKVEWKVEGKIPSVFASNGINIFGKIVPILQEVFSDDDLSVDYAGAFMSEDEECKDDEDDEEEVISTANGSDAVNSQDNTNTDKKDDVAKPKKRKLSDADDGVGEEEGETAEKSTNNKLTKKQRKQLAKEKAQQLEDTLSASRNDEDESKTSKKKKKKKKNETETEELSRPTSLTRERRLPSGVTVRDVLVGTGAPVKSGKKLSLHYTGSLLSTGKVFDKNHSKQHPLVFRQGTGEVIRGLERGLEGMKVGGERVISIPSKLGYGKKGAGVDIPPDSDLSFEVKLLKVG